MRKPENLRNLKCVICGNNFIKYLTDNSINIGKGKVCSKLCKKEFARITLTKKIARNCVKCNKKFTMKPSEDRRGYLRKYCSLICFAPNRNGTSISPDGYYVICGKKMHRLIMEKYIGRKLLLSEIVHHINENKLDNRIENLQIVTRSEHNKIHKFLHKK